jgi:hypothetical protein
MDRVDQSYLEELVKNQGSGDGSKSSRCDVHIVPAGSEGEDAFTLEEILEKAKELGKGNQDFDSGLVLSYLKVISLRFLFTLINGKFGLLILYIVCV